MAIDPSPAPVPAHTPEAPYANKAIIAALTVIGIVVQRVIESGEFDWSEEGVVSLIGAVGTVLVWAVSNFKRRGIL